MRYLKVIIVFLTFNSFANGGDDVIRISFDCFEPNLNLQFFGINDTINYTDKKKDFTAFVISNIAVYDITNNKTNYVFNDAEKRHIVGFYFESKYIQEHKTIEFNNAYKPSGSYESGLYEYNSSLYQHSNNRNITSRPLSNNLIIVTKDLITKSLTFWVCDKFGNNLKKEIEINKDWNWEIDVKNQLIRISKQVGLKIEIQNIKY